jgi:hypothetical protein
MLRQVLAVACCLAPLSVSAATSKGASAKDVPSWVEELGSRLLPEYPGKFPAAVILKEQHVTVSPSGELTVQTRHAVKIFTAEGRKQAIAIAPYGGAEKPPELRAWLFAPNGFIKAYSKKDTADVGPFSEWELYNDFRLRMIQDENPEIGAIFAYESESHPVALFAQHEFDFQTNLPCLQSRYVLTLPSGWTASATVLNGTPIQPFVNGSTYTWELNNLPFRESEVDSPQMEGMVPRLAVNFQPPDATNIRMRCFGSWQDISQWYSGLIASDDAASPEIAAKVAALTASAKSTGKKIALSPAMSSKSAMWRFN